MNNKTKMSKRSVKFIVPFLLSTGILLLQFQNCAKQPLEQSFSDEISSQKLKFFDYRYTEAPEIYFDVQLIPETEDSTHIDYKVMAFAANADASTDTIDYSIDVYDKNNSTICATKTGSLTSGNSLVEEGCLISKSNPVSYIIIKVKKSGGNWHEHKQQYD